MSKNDLNPPGTEHRSATARSPRIFISAAEPSGDRHAAALLRAIRERQPDVQFFGVAGPLMQAEGCEAMDDLASRAAMLLGAVSLAARAYRLMGRIQQRVMTDPPDLAIFVDSPALHLPMARRIRPTGVPTLYYIAPQLWAWAPRRIEKVRRYIDRLAAILPFEEAYFRERGVTADFVGHPLVSQPAQSPPKHQLVRELKQLGNPVIACLPGSRKHVVREVLPGQIEVARRIAEVHTRAAFVFAAAGEDAAETIRSNVANERFPYRVELSENASVLSAADFALVASGTATLEVACHNVPMVVMYNGSKWGYRLIGRHLIQTRHLSLVNILAERELVPEFMPYYTSTEPIADQALDILASADRRDQIRNGLRKIVESLGTADASANTAKIALEMIRPARRSPGPMSPRV